jgi:hypothetical protein
MNLLSVFDCKYTAAFGGGCRFAGDKMEIVQKRPKMLT